MVLVKWKTQEMGEMWSGKLGNTISKSTVWGGTPQLSSRPLFPPHSAHSSQAVVPCSETILLSQAEQELRGWRRWGRLLERGGRFLRAQEDSE